MKVKGLLFDLDGVIVDTAKYHYIAWKSLASSLGIEFTEKDNELLKGVSRMRSLEIILEIGGVTMDDEEKERCCTEKNELYLSYINKMQEDEILPGVKEFLRDARERGYKIALGSASKNSRLILERLNLEGYFDAIIDGTVVSKAKPDPEVFLKGAEALGLEPSDCIVFEDAVAGIEAAHRAGMKAVGIGTAELLPEADINIRGVGYAYITDLLEELSEVEGVA